MTTTSTQISPLSHRDRAVLLAVRAGRCEVSGTVAVSLTIDGLGCSDQFVGHRLVRDGFITAPVAGPGLARLTSSGHAVIEGGERS